MCACVFDEIYVKGRGIIVNWPRLMPHENKEHVFLPFTYDNDIYHASLSIVDIIGYVAASKPVCYTVYSDSWTTPNVKIEIFWILHYEKTFYCHNTTELNSLLGVSNGDLFNHHRD